MSKSAPAIEIIDSDEYLVRERASSTRNEYVNGIVYAMAGATERHDRIAGNLFSALANHLPDRCVPFMTDMKLRIAQHRAVLFYYPDSMVCCGPSDQSKDWRDDPILVGEVLSPSTERVDRGEKFEACIRVPSLQEVILVEQAMARVEIFRRSTGWSREVFLAGASFRLASIDFGLGVDSLYRRVEF